MGFFHRKKEVKTFDRSKKQPVLRSSICTGEQVAGFRDRETGKLEEIALIRDDRELQEFLSAYGIRLEELKREW